VSPSTSVISSAAEGGEKKGVQGLPAGVWGVPKYPCNFLLPPGGGGKMGKIMENLSYEEAFERLEAAITALQDGKLPLEQSLSYYQEGMKLAQYCNELLQKAELSVQQLSVDSAGSLSVLPLDM
jgi:exodeoxyribonuclease VII small subunit